MSVAGQSTPKNDSTRPVRVLVVSRLLLWRRDEGSELWEQVAGLVEANTAGEIEILVTDCVNVYAPHVHAGQMRLELKGTIAASWWTGVDVVHVCHLLPVIRHLLVGILFRVRGARIVFSPMAFLTDDFGLRSWTHRRPRVWTGSKAIALYSLRRAWNAIAHAFVCQSDYEVRSSRLPKEKCAVIHWPRPDVALLTDDRVLTAVPSNGAQAPIAFVSRMDPWRKGMDRLCTWLSEYASTLPRPAVVLLVPRGPGEPPQLEPLVRAGLIEWDWTSRGAALAAPLQRCRGALLLSRYDAQPRSLREALWLGLPIICTPECGFDQVVAMIGAGKVVHGDRPSEIQAAFDSLGAQKMNTDDVHRLLNRVETGRFVLSVLVAVGAGQHAPRSYFNEHTAHAAHRPHFPVC